MPAALPPHSPCLALPSQILICGDPPGSDMCADTDYNSSLPILVPDSVSYNGREYTGATWLLPLPAGLLSGWHTSVMAHAVTE